MTALLASLTRLLAAILAPARHASLQPVPVRVTRRR